MDRTQGPAPALADRSCTLDAAGLQARTAEFGDFFATEVTGIERPEPATLRMELRPGERAGQTAGQLAAAETTCCSFFSFTLVATAGQLLLEVRVPPSHIQALDGMAAHADRARVGLPGSAAASRPA